jgi:predicted flap endonuclease-1-like 5' DNA nuclease
MQKNVQAIADQSLALTLLPLEHWAQWADFFVQQPATWMTSLAKSTEQAQAERPAEFSTEPSAELSAETSLETSPVELDLSESIDDLTRISGVGPKLAKKLNQAGVTRFVQIAELSDEAIAQLEREVVRFNGRIKRDDWPGQARQFMLDV